MTTIFSLFGILGRFAGDLLTSALGWASSLLLGRVPRSHQIFLVLMMAGSFLWLVIVAAVILPSIAAFVLTTTPHPGFISGPWLATALLVTAVILPLVVGLAGYLVPTDDERVGGLAPLLEMARGYLLTPLISALLVFLAVVGIVRKVRSRRHGWVDTHVPIVLAPGGYDGLVTGLEGALGAAGLPASISDAPRVLTMPAWVLTRVAGPNVRKLRSDRLVELCATDLRVGVYPYDIAISSRADDRLRVRAAILAGLTRAGAHQTTSAEGQAFETRLQALQAAANRHRPPAAATLSNTFEAVDADLLRVPTSTDEWDILFRLRLQVERELLHRIVARDAFLGLDQGAPDLVWPPEPATVKAASGRVRQAEAIEAVLRLQPPAETPIDRAIAR